MYSTHLYGRMKFRFFRQQHSKRHKAIKADGQYFVDVYVVDVVFLYVYVYLCLV